MHIRGIGVRLSERALVINQSVNQPNNESIDRSVRSFILFFELVGCNIYIFLCYL